MTEATAAVDATELMQDVLDTPELTAPPAEPDAHRGTITNVSFETFESGSSAIKLELASQDAPFDTNYFVFLPKLFVENIAVDPTTLPEEDKNNQKQQYAINIANSTKDAELQRLRAIAAEQGRTTAGATRPTNITEYVELMAMLLNGVEIVFTRRPDAKAEDPRFKNRLRVTRIYPVSAINNAKTFKKYRKAWEQISA